jgi:hypothetical protein
MTVALTGYEKKLLIIKGTDVRSLCSTPGGLDCPSGVGTGREPQGSLAGFPQVGKAPVLT